MCSNLEIDVNGEQIFFVNKKILACHSNRISKLFGKSARTRGTPRVIFHDFPGGAESFELVASFCYNNGSIDITPSNIFLLHCGGAFMEVSKLIEKTKLYLGEIHCWTWSEFLNGLQQCQILFSSMDFSPQIQDFLNFILGNFNLPSYCIESSTSSSESSSFRFSLSEIGSKSSKSPTSNDFLPLKDLSFLNIHLFEKLLKSMIFLHFDHPTICSFIFHYQKSRFFLCTSQEEKCILSKTTINLLSMLNGISFSCRRLLDAFGTSLNLKMRTHERKKLENLLGSRLDEFTINDLLIRGSKKCAFDVDLTLRLVKVFVSGRIFNGVFFQRAKKVACLIDLYMVEVAPDPYLKPYKFLALAKSLPDTARESHDRIYHAVDIYLEVHSRLSEEQKMMVCGVLELNKLSVATLRHLVGNNRFQRLQADNLHYFQQPDSVVEEIFCYLENSRGRSKKRRVKKLRKKIRRLVRYKSRTKVFESYHAKTLPRLCH